MKVEIWASKPNVIQGTSNELLKVEIQLFRDGVQGLNGDAGEQGIQGLKGDSGGFYTHTQNVTSSIWEVNHGLEFMPSVQAFNSAGNEIEGLIQHINTNKLIINFDNSAISGIAYLS